MLKKIGIVLLLLLAAAGAGGGYWYYTHYYQAPTSNENAVYVTQVSELITSDSGYVNRYAGIVEAQETVEVKIESGRKVNEVKVHTGDVVTKGQLLFEYDLTSIQQDLKEAELDLERLQNEAEGLKSRIETLIKEQKNANKDNQLNYTIEIETAKMNLKKNEYDQTSKQAQIDRLKLATVNTDVRSEIDGVIQKIDASKMNSDSSDGIMDTMDEGGYGYMYGNSSDSNAFITILSTGEYRVKGSINEMNTMYLMEGDSILVRSRINEEEIWTGTLSLIDRQNPNKNQNDMWGMSSANEEVTSTSYPFYVQLDSSEGLMLGQHVYIEPDRGQRIVKTGIWLSEGYLVFDEVGKPFVWAASDKNRLIKKYVTLGDHDEELWEYEITGGLTKEDYIAWPTDQLSEGMPTTTDIMASMMYTDYGNMSDEDFTMMGTDTIDMEAVDMDLPDDEEMMFPAEESADGEGRSSMEMEDIPDFYGEFEDEMMYGADYSDADMMNEDIPELPDSFHMNDSLSPVSGPGMEDLG